MNIFGIGPMEMAVIGVIALLIFGPDKLPEVMGQAGKMVRDFRKMTSQFTSEFEGTIAEAKALTGGLADELNGVTKGLGGNTTKKTTTPSTAKTAAKTTTAAKSSTASKTSTTSKTGAAAKSTTSSTAKTTSTTSAAKPAKPATPVATREDPTNAFSLFEPDIIEKPRRNRVASPKAITDLLPRDIFAEGEPVAASNGSSNGVAVAENDALTRARQRRKTAGYNRAQV